MADNYNNEDELFILENQIKQAELDGRSITPYILKEIEILQHSIDKFMLQMKEQGRENDIQVAEIEIRQYSLMRSLAQKINKPVDKYDELIKNVKIRIFGEENYNSFF